MEPGANATAMCPFNLHDCKLHTGAAKQKPLNCALQSYAMHGYNLTVHSTDKCTNVPWLPRMQPCIREVIYYSLQTQNHLY